MSALLTIEKSLYRVIQDVISKNKNFYDQVAVEIQDSSLVQAELAKDSKAPTGKSAASQSSSAAAAAASLQNLSLSNKATNQEEEEKKTE